MHCSANIGPAGDTALFFGLSGTGKTTLSADPRTAADRRRRTRLVRRGRLQHRGRLLRQDIRLSPRAEPQIWNAIRFGSVLENVVVDPRTRQPDFDDEPVTRRTRAPPTRWTSSTAPSRRSRGGHPRTILFLTCDAFGVLPPLSRLTPEQALVSFPIGLHGQGGGHRGGRDRAGGDVQHLLRGPVSAAAPDALRRHAARTAARARRPGLAGQHRLDRRSLWRWPAHQADAHASHGSRHSGRVTPEAASAPIRCSASRCRRPVRGCRRKCSDSAKAGRTRRPMTSGRGHWRICSATTSRTTPRKCPNRCVRQDRISDPARSTAFVRFFPSPPARTSYLFPQSSTSDSVVSGPGQWRGQKSRPATAPRRDGMISCNARCVLLADPHASTPAGS